MTSAEPQLLTTVRNHWWWRPGWRTGRHFYACHLTLDDQPQLRGLVQRYQDAFRHLPNLDLIPLRWLHITTQGIGFADEISPADLADVTAAVQDRLRDIEPPVAAFHQPLNQVIFAGYLSGEAHQRGAARPSTHRLHGGRPGCSAVS